MEEKEKLVEKEKVEKSEKETEKMEVKKLNDYKAEQGSTNPHFKDEVLDKEKKEEVKSEVKEEKKEEKVEKKDGKKSKKKVEEKPKIKKEFAFARGRSLHISKKQGMYICSFIKGKKMDDAVEDLQEVMLYKRAIPFKGEIPHRKGKGMMSGRYPIKAIGLFINILKALKGNSLVNGLDIDRTIVYSASANWAARPARRGNKQAKRTHVFLKAKEFAGKGGTN
jgi:large subunit ribosomal protein L22